MRVEALVLESGGCSLTVYLYDRSPVLAVRCGSRVLETVLDSTEGILELVSSLTRYLDDRGVLVLLTIVAQAAASRAKRRAESLERIADTLATLAGLAEKHGTRTSFPVTLRLQPGEEGELHVLAERAGVQLYDCRAEDGVTRCWCVVKSERAAEALRREAQRLREEALTLSLLVDYAERAADQARAATETVITGAAGGTSGGEAP